MDTEATERMQEAIAAALRAKRAEKRITLEDLERRSDVPQRSIQRYFGGERSIPVTTLISLAHAMGVEAWEIIDAAQNIFNTAEQESRVNSSDT